MKLVTRFSAYFLTALALVLAGFSATVHFVAHRHLHRQLDDRLEHALDTLEASVDIEPGGLEWEPTDRRIALGLDLGPDEVRWAVHDGHRRVVDRSANAEQGGFPTGWEARSWPIEPADGTSFGTSLGWRMAGRRMPLKELLLQGRGHPDDEPGYEVQYPLLVLVAGLRAGPVKATLDRLGLTLFAVSLTIWLLAAAGGRLLARWALAPLTRMAEIVGSMSVTDLARRVPTPGTRDELDALGHAFNGLLNRLNDAFERQQRFATDASHQLRTPLAALLGQVQLARRRERPIEEYQRVLDRVNDEGNRLREIVEALLFLAQPEPPRLALSNLEPIEWLSEHLKRWAEHAPTREFHLEAEFQRLKVQVHPAMLAQLLDNLLDNACKYSPPGTPIVLKVSRSTQEIQIDVINQNHDLTPEEALHVFEPFFRSESARRTGQPGLGLGLAVARRLATVLQATLEVRIDRGRSTCFGLRLPIAPEDVAKDESGRPDLAHPQV